MSNVEKSKVKQHIQLLLLSVAVEVICLVSKREAVVFVPTLSLIGDGDFGLWC